MVLVIVNIISFSVFAQDNQVTVGRYITVSENPLTGQSDLLSQTFEVHFPRNINTLGDAMHYLLRFSGYKLAAKNTMPLSVQNLLNQPLPEVDRNLGPLTLKDGLLTLAGEPFQLIVDPVHRLISFSLKSSYAKIY